MPIAIAAANRSRWKKKFSFGVQHDHPSSSSIPNSVSSSSCSSVGTTPMSFICPISSSLMFDPVITPTGHTFERACIEACRQFNFTPPSLSLISSLDFSSTSSSLLIPNAALRAAIIDWCDHFALPHPQPLSQEYARTLVRNLVLRTTNNSYSQIQMEDEEDYAHHNNSNNNKNKQQQQQQQQPSSTSSSSSSSSYSSSCCSNPSSSSTSSFSSSDIHITAAASTSSSSLLVHVDPKTPKSTATAAKTPICISTAADPSSTNTTSTSTATLIEDSEAESILVNLKNPQISVRVSCLVTLRHSARESSQRRISLCTPRLLSALVPMILSTNSSIQINATAALVNLSIEPANKVKIVRSGAVPPLVQALKSSTSSSSSSSNHSEEARYNAAGALFNLVLEDENKLSIGVLGAIPPLVNLFCQGQQQQSELAGGHDAARVEAGMALYHLSLAPNNLSKIAKTPGAIKSILNIATGGGPDFDDGEVRKVVTEQHEETIRLRLQRVAMMLLASLARRNEGRAALMDADSVKAMVGVMMKDGLAAGREEEHCLAVMYEMSKGGLRFRALARAAGVEKVLLAMAAGHDNKEGCRGEVGKEMVRRTLKVIRGDEEKGGVTLMLGDEYDNDNDEDAARDWCHCGGGDTMILVAVQEPVLLTFKF